MTIAASPSPNARPAELEDRGADARPVRPSALAQRGDRRDALEGGVLPATQRSCIQIPFRAIAFSSGGFSRDEERIEPPREAPSSRRPRVVIRSRPMVPSRKPRGASKLALPNIPSVPFLSSLVTRAQHRGARPRGMPTLSASADDRFSRLEGGDDEPLRSPVRQAHTRGSDSGAPGSCRRLPGEHPHRLQPHSFGVTIRPSCAASPVPVQRDPLETTLTRAPSASRSVPQVRRRVPARRCSPITSAGSSRPALRLSRSRGGSAAAGQSLKCRHLDLAPHRPAPLFGGGSRAQRHVQPLGQGALGTGRALLNDREDTSRASRCRSFAADVQHSTRFPPRQQTQFDLLRPTTAQGALVGGSPAAASSASHTRSCSSSRSVGYSGNDASRAYGAVERWARSPAAGARPSRASRRRCRAAAGHPPRRRRRRSVGSMA